MKSQILNIVQALSSAAQKAISGGSRMSKRKRDSSCEDAPELICARGRCSTIIIIDPSNVLHLKAILC